MLEPLSAILEGAVLEQVKEEFNGGCTVEIATFDKFTDFLGDETYDLIIFDTAPTGHTLRLMTLPNEWDKYIKKSAEGKGQTCIGPVSQIEGSRQKYSHAVSMLQDASRTTSLPGKSVPKKLQCMKPCGLNQNWNEQVFIISI